MSSENIHITRQNYEEYFLLYVDHELSPAERMAVENFVSAHPDLREELDILLQTTVLDIPDASLSDKSFLMADSMKLNTVDDSLLLYLDNELKGSEKSKVEALLRSSADHKLQYDILLRTKLPKEKIVYPYKAELYRRSESRPVAYWLRIAAAVIVMAALALVYFLNGDTTGTPPAVAGIKPNIEQVIQPQQEQVAAIQVEDNTSPAEKVTNKKSKQVPVTVREEPVVEEPRDQIAHNPQPQPDPVRIINTNPGTETTASVLGTIADQQNINTKIVTQLTDPTYNNLKDVVATQHENVFPDNEKGTSVKGLLRKATRFIEKRTGVNPVNDDDELLIGAVSIKLK